MRRERMQELTCRPRAARSHVPISLAWLTIPLTSLLNSEDTSPCPSFYCLPRQFLESRLPCNRRRLLSEVYFIRKGRDNIFMKYYISAITHLSSGYSIWGKSKRSSGLCCTFISPCSSASRKPLFSPLASISFISSAVSYNSIATASFVFTSLVNKIHLHGQPSNEDTEAYRTFGQRWNLRHWSSPIIVARFVLSPRIRLAST